MQWTLRVLVFLLLRIWSSSFSHRSLSQVWVPPCVFVHLPGCHGGIWHASNLFRMKFLLRKISLLRLRLVRIASALVWAASLLVQVDVIFLEEAFIAKKNGHSDSDEKLTLLSASICPIFDAFCWIGAPASRSPLCFADPLFRVGQMAFHSVKWSRSPQCVGRGRRIWAENTTLLSCDVLFFVLRVGKPTLVPHGSAPAKGACECGFSYAFSSCALLTCNPLTSAWIALRSSIKNFSHVLSCPFHFVISGQHFVTVLLLAPATGDEFVARWVASLKPYPAFSIQQMMQRPRPAPRNPRGN